MQGHPPFELSLVGLQRSGTNYAVTVLNAALQNVQLYLGYTWKHAFREEAEGAANADNIVVVTRHPLLWLQSCLLNSDKEIKKSRSEYFVGDIDPVIGFANVYNRFYRGWLAHKKAVGGYVLRYEDVVEDGSKTLNKLFSSQFKIAELSSGFASLPMSVQMGADDLKAVLDRECSLPVEVAGLFGPTLSSRRYGRPVVHV